ncbi:MAG: hypothetical protein RI947_1183 [Candidatus Parcubacteria bacterium]|jgi:hypothetical protein
MMQNDPKQSQTQLSDILSIIVFLLILCLPFIVGRLAFVPRSEVQENRKLTERPVFNSKTIDTFPQKYQKYFDDTFPLRTHLVRLQNYINIALLKSSPRTDVLLGKHDWFFYNVEGPLQKEKLFNDQDLSIIKQRLETVQELLNRQGIQFYVFITPNTQSIYPEYLPDYFHGERSRFDQLTAYLNQTSSSVSVVDPRRALIAAKQQYQPYRRYDTHWNDYGAYIAYRDLLKTISAQYPLLQPAALDSFTITYKTTPNTDLLSMVGLNGYKKESAPDLEPKGGYTATQHIVSCRFKPNCEQIRTTNVDTSLPRLLMYRDSFSNHLIPFIAEHFSDALYLWKHTVAETDLRQQKPDIVVYQIVERDISELRNLEIKMD